MNTEQLIIDKVEEKRDEIIKFFQKIVRIPSETGNEEPLAKAMKDAFDSFGFETKLIEAAPHRPNVWAKYKGQEPGKTLVFNGHLDVVPPGPREEWDRDPYSGDIENGILYGRGAVDMKSGDCGCALATWIIKELGIPLKGNVVLTYAADEQIGSVLGTQYMAKNGYMDGDYMINCEPTNCKTVDIVQKGILRFNVVIYGESIHGARPWLGISALDKAVDFLNQIRKLSEELWTRKYPLLYPPTIVAGTIKGGTLLNMVPSKVEIAFTRRMIPGETHDQASKEVKDILEDLAANDPDFKYDLLFDEYSRASVLDVPPDCPSVTAIRKAHQRVHGTELPLGGKDAGTDASHVADLTGVPCPIYGPGDIKYSLGANEQIPVQDVVDVVKVYALTIYNLLGL